MKKKNKLSEKRIVVAILGVIMLVVVIIGFNFGWGVFIPKEYKKPQFIITKEVCKEIFYRNWYDLDAGDSFSSFNIDIGPNLKYYDIRPLAFRAWEYVENEVCFDVFREEGIYPDRIDSSQSNSENLPFYITNIHQEEFYVNKLTCKGIFYEETNTYRMEKKIELELNNLFVKLPEFNYSKVRLKEWGGKFDDEIYLINDNRYWDAQFRIIPPEPTIICEQVEVDGLNLEYSKQKLSGSEAGIRFFKTGELTEKLLNENCECENYCDNPDFPGFDCKNKPCFLWSCGNHTIQRIK